MTKGREKVLDSQLLSALEEQYAKYWWPVEYPEEASSDPFKNLIITVLSQNTSEINCVRAYRGLAARFQIAPETLAEADIDQIRDSIRQGGLYNVKSKRIKQLSKAVLHEFDGDLTHILELPKKRAKERLTELPGVGDKTADVLLASKHGYHAAFVVDTHMNRIAKRIGLVPENAGYTDIQDALKRFVPKTKDDRAGGLLWLLAKYTCKALKPKCFECPLTRVCDFSRQESTQLGKNDSLTSNR